MATPLNSISEPAIEDSKTNHFITFIQGVAIGAANAIPGVSGGTLALVFGIYEKLINSIKTLARGSFWRSVLSFKISDAYRAVNGNFLVVLVLGALIAVLSLAQGLEWGFVNYPVLVLSFFFGLILASVVPVARYIDVWDFITVCSALMGFLIAFKVVGLTPAELPNSWPFLMFSGALALATMIIPGISGSFVLVLLGNYQYVLNMVNERNLPAIAVFAFGGIIGLVSLAQLLSWLFKTYRNVTLAVLAGFMLGSLRKIWPFKAAGFEDTEVPVNIWPSFMINDSLNMQLLFSIGLMVFGIALVLLLDRFGKKPSS